MLVPMRGGRAQRKLGGKDHGYMLFPIPASVQDFHAYEDQVNTRTWQLLEQRVRPDGGGGGGGGRGRGEMKFRKVTLIKGAINTCAVLDV